MRIALLTALAATSLSSISSAQLMEPVLLGIATNRPTCIAFAPGVTHQSYLADKTGRIWLFRDGSLAGVFLDIRDRVEMEGESGLLGMAFDPDFQNNGTFYLSYTQGGPQAATRYGDSMVSSFQVMPGSVDLADPNSETVLWGPYPQMSFGHKAGDLEMGLDGTIFFSLGDGDGGSAAGTGTAQDPADPRGSILRLDPNMPFPHVPADNPFVGLPGHDPHIWAMGFRNPYRIDVDPETGDVYVADVGASRWEEITRLPFGVGGLNGGWPCQEGDQCLSHPSCVCPSATITAPPVRSKAHGPPDNYCAVTGGLVYRGSAIPGLYGQYIFTDFCSGMFHGIIDPAGAALDVDYSSIITGPTGPIRFVADLGRDHDGEVYIIDHYGAQVWKLVPKAGFETYCESNPNSTGLAAELTITGSPSLTDASMTLSVEQLPLDAFGFFLMSRGRTVFPNFFGSDGILCVNTTIYRWNDMVFDSGPLGTAERTTDLTDFPILGSVEAGETWHFQYWTRDMNPNSTSNTSSAVAVTFAP